MTVPAPRASALELHVDELVLEMPESLGELEAQQLVRQALALVAERLRHGATAFGEIESEEKKRRSKKELIDLLKNEGERFAKFLEELSDDKLAEQITEDPSQPTKSRLEALMSAKEHEMHCRGQLMLMERMIGIVPHLTRKYAEMEREMKEAAEKKAGATTQA
jgi:uncharacterized damage-inducible protein DinB